MKTWVTVVVGMFMFWGELAAAQELPYQDGNSATADVWQSQANGLTAVPPSVAAAPSVETGVNPAAYVEGGDAAGPRYVTPEQLKAAVKGSVWTKGDFSVTPYGILWANMVLENGRTTPGNYPLYVARPRPDANDNVDLDARSTRLGIDVLGPQIALLNCARSGGKVEIDFQRQIDVDNKPSLLLRHAYAEVKNDEFRLLFGQTWDVISPLNPGVLFYSVGWDGGNIGYRRAQLRAERYMAVSDTFQFIAQGSADDGSTTDVAGTPATYSALHSGWPILEGRLAVKLGERGPGCLPWEFGVSSHVGEVIYDFKANTAAAGNAPTSPFNFTSGSQPRRTWSLNTDIRMPITSCFGVQGELFIGQNLGPFLGCDGQSVDVVAYTSGNTVLQYASGNGIRSRGGWIDVWYDLAPKWHTHTGYSIDDVFDQDVASGRVYNGFYFANLSYDLTSKCLVGIEYLNWKTIWAGPSVTATSNNYNFVLKYSF